VLFPHIFRLLRGSVIGMSTRKYLEICLTSSVNEDFIGIISVSIQELIRGAREMPYEVSRTDRMHLSRTADSQTISEIQPASSHFERLNISKSDEAPNSTTTRPRGARGEVLKGYPTPNAPTRTAPSQTRLERQALTMT
jgi:hypothetical protein